MVPERYEATLTITAGSTWSCRNGGDVDLGRVIDRAEIINRTAAAVTVYVAENYDACRSTNGARATQIATGESLYRARKQAGVAIHNPEAATSATVCVSIDGGAQGNQDGSVWAYHAIPLTADIDWMTADTNRVTADQAELR